MKNIPSNVIFKRLRIFFKSMKAVGLIKLRYKFSAEQLGLIVPHQWLNRDAYKVTLVWMHDRSINEVHLINCYLTSFFNYIAT